MAALNALNAIVSARPSGSSAHRQASYAFLTALQPGQQLRARVQAGFSNGEFSVALDTPDMAENPLMHMKLPTGTRPGDALNLIFVSRHPRPAFMLMTGTSSPTAISVPLSETGRFISGLLGHSAFPNSRATLSGTIPLLSAPPADGVQLARNLAGALGFSGLFYESHQAQWVAGSRPLGDLLLEPQAPLSGLRPRLADTNAQASGSNTPGMRRDIATDGHAPVHPDALALVRQQLDVFETRQISWQGLAWPGQPIEWEVAEEKRSAPAESDEPDESDQAQAAWQTRLNLALPNLGQISASLRLDAHGVEVRLIAEEPVTAFMLRAGAAPLVSGLESAGIKLLGIGVDLDEEDGAK
ncbi:flagellar hook-length control protein FliK [Nitrosospira briensis]|uniref:flagellar hook-length control protein FliK n=1 Tax=Nitrosospira briensis TaxID=35799 RepID=UPI0008F372A4|nr:flagellar hook-length control protein FliK [Nitrosospira briensis]SFN71022.1 hook-length control protein FliK [Nitrosospira briensis]